MLRLGCRNLFTLRVASRETWPYTHIACCSRATRHAMSSQSAAQDAVCASMPPSSAASQITGSTETMAKRKVAVFVAYVGSSFRGRLVMEGSAHTNALKNALICFEGITYVPLRGLQIPADAWLTMLLFKAFRYSVISLVARLKMFYSRLYMMRVLFYLQTTGTCTKLAGRVAAGQIKECTRLPM